MQELTAQHVHDLKEWTIGHGLEDPNQNPRKELVEIVQKLRPMTYNLVSSLKARSPQTDMMITRGDVVLLGPDYNWAAGEVWFHVSCNDGASGPLTLISPMLIEKIHSSCEWAKYRTNEFVDLVPTEHLICSAVWRPVTETASVDGCNYVVCIWPAQYRRFYKHMTAQGRK